jgi:large subunit ribosomal protein L19
MNMELVKEVTAKQMKKDIPTFGPGDTVKVHVRIVEGDKERIQNFQGVVIARRGTGISETFIVRKMSSSVGVERVFQIHSPLIARIEVLKRGNVRRSKLFYLRNRSGKGARISEDRKLTAQSIAEEAKLKAIEPEVKDTKGEHAEKPKDAKHQAAPKAAEVKPAPQAKPVEEKKEAAPKAE